MHLLLSLLFGYLKLLEKRNQNYDYLMNTKDGSHQSRNISDLPLGAAPSSRGRERKHLGGGNKKKDRERVLQASFLTAFLPGQWMCNSPTLQPK